MLKAIKNGELYYFGYNLKSLAEKYGTPLKISFLDVIKERVCTLKKAFDTAINNNKYSSSFIYLNANKANYSKEEIETSFLYNDGLETSSYYDLLLTRKIFSLHPEFKNKFIVCNGFKLNDYLDEIIAAHNEKYKIIDIIDSVDEYEYLKKQNVDLQIGLRVHIESQYSEEKEDDRFGLMPDELELILKDIKNTKLVFNTIHFHQRGFDYEDDKFRINFEKVYEIYAECSKEFNTLINFNMGGGTPLPVEEGFDYYKWADDVIKFMKELSLKYNVREPNLLSENGKYSQKDCIVNVYKVIGRKNTDKYQWNIIDGSLLIAMPEFYALGEPIEVTAINGLDLKKKKCKLAGVTCDCDDVLFNKESGYIELPDTDDLYIGILGTGSYQNSMNGKGGVHHCLLPEEKDIIIYKENGIDVIKIRNELQSIEEVYKLLKF